MTDGADMEKAALNYEHIMLYFSNKHIFGKFSELLNVDVNKELKEFFDNLFIIYSYDKKSVFEITNALWRVKQIILKNTFKQEKEERLFGVDSDKTDVNLSLVRMKAYVYYTRFCNLGNYLAENYYSGNKCIWDKKEDAEEDFGLAMKYFIFNDKIHQCVYTGIQYKFLIDFLPKKEKFVRFNDGITRIKEMKAESDNVFLDVVKKIPGHISGAIIQNGKADFYSVGKNFVQCLFKYFDSSHTDWSVRIYSNVPINYVDYNEKRYSIQAFTQMKLSDDNFIVEGNKIDLSLDISRFALGRDGKDTDTLEGFLKYFDSNLDFSKEKVASISDEEILFTKLPDVSEEYEYTLDKIEGVILKKICLRMIGKNVDTIAGKIEFIAGDSQNDSIECDKNKQELNELNKEVKAVNDNINHPIWKIIEYVKDNITKSKKKPQDLEELNVYSGNDKTIYENLKNHVAFKIEGEK
jgi:hypothetical protein